MTWTDIAPGDYALARSFLVPDDREWLKIVATVDAGPDSRPRLIVTLRHSSSNRNFALALEHLDEICPILR